MRAHIICPIELYHLPPPVLCHQPSSIHADKMLNELEQEFMRSLDMRMDERNGQSRRLTEGSKCPYLEVCLVFACKDSARRTKTKGSVKAEMTYSVFTMHYTWFRMKGA
jgi:hypothetical protein